MQVDMRELDDLKNKVYETVFMKSPAAIALFVSPEYRCILTNEAFRRLYGDAGGFIGKSITQLLPEVMESINGDLTSIIRKRSEHYISELLTRINKDGMIEEYYIDYRLLPVVDDSGCTAVAVRAYDYTSEVLERRRLQRHTELEFDKLEKVAESLDEGILAYTAQGVLSFANPSSLLIFGCEDFEEIRCIMDPSVTDSKYAMYDLEGGFVSREERPLGRALTGKLTMEFYNFVRFDKPLSKYLNLSGIPIYDAVGDILMIILIVRDMTEHAKRDIEMADLLKSKDRFLSMASHELKTPLSVLASNIQLLAMRDKDFQGQRRSHLFETLLIQCKKLERYINDLLDISRLTNGYLTINMDAVDIGELVSSVVQDESKLHPTHSFSVDGVFPRMLMGDRDRLEQVLCNLISNAVRYSPEGSKIRVKSEVQEKQLFIHVIDNGAGIVEEDLSRIFDLYYRSTAAKDVSPSGLGLGLYICREIVNLHGGDIQVTSVYGLGSTFTIILPLSADAIDRQASAM